MTFRYLPQDELDGLYDAVVKTGLGNPMTLFSLLSGIDPHYAQQLQNVALPPTALLLDTLNRLNETERIVDGTVPFERWLKNAAKLAGPRPDAQAFTRALSEIAQRASGAPPIENLDSLPELLEQIVHQDDMVPISFFAGGVAASQSVALIRVPRHDGRVPRLLSSGEPYLSQGTAWFLTPELVITNHHVINARQPGESTASREDLELQATKAWLELDFDDDAMKPGRADAAKLESCDVALDYAILRLAQSQTRKPLEVRPGKVDVNTPVNIIQHPLGNAKRVACRNNLVTASTDNQLRYFTDTLRGSSGSPVFDDTWRVVALHYSSAAVQGVSFQGKQTAWVNVGVPIGRIVEHVKAKAPELLQELRKHQPLL
ncbi:trypsin-like peptidase domain-containing protein [Archangium violaceum]|uniref:trypsin-like peptidase domain-containing protein n=1 Tax=Archangium violaceum TaxID=83451 RepID=UPI0019519101|nr:trypsin-like peptidase domain-containing protein [Archangium violaceum]QRN92900.1 trypsin-like peptidase domain-containing protein [Archangium violaceum]